MLSALGFLSSDVRHDFSTPVGTSVPSLKSGELKSVFGTLEKQGRAALTAEGFDASDMRFVRVLDCRYHRQVFSVEVAVEPGDLKTPGYDWLVEKFEQSYQSLYQHNHKNVAGFIDTCRIAAFGVQPALELKMRPTGGADPQSGYRGKRSVYLGSWTDAAVYWFDDLLPGMVIKGPALVDSASTSVLVVPGSIATIDRLGSINITRGRDEN